MSRVRRILLILVAMLCALGLSARYTWASCVGAFVLPAEHIGQADAIFSGRVVEADELVMFRHITLRDATIQLEVRQVWRGPVQSRIAVFDRSEISPRVGDVYLVYAMRQDGWARDRLFSSSCIGSNPLADAGDDLAELGPARVVLPAAGTSERSAWIELAARSVGVGVLSLVALLALWRWRRPRRVPQPVE